MKFLLLSTRTPAVAEHGGEDAGKTAHYMVIWLSSRSARTVERNGQRGDWGVGVVGDEQGAGTRLTKG